MKETLGTKLKELRKNANLSLRELAAKLNIDFTYLSKIENDKTDESTPSVKILQKLASVLKTSESELLALAKRIPKDLEEKMTSNKATMDFFRTVSNKDLEEIIKEFKKKEK